MGVLADNRADVEAAAGALRAGADLLEGLLRSCCLLVAKGEIYRVMSSGQVMIKTSEGNFQQTVHDIEEGNERIMTCLASSQEL